MTIIIDDAVQPIPSVGKREIDISDIGPSLTVTYIVNYNGEALCVGS